MRRRAARAEDADGPRRLRRRVVRAPAIEAAVYGGSIDLRDDVGARARRRCSARCSRRAPSRARGRSRTRRRTRAAACGPRAARRRRGCSPTAPRTARSRCPSRARCRESGTLRAGHDAAGRRRARGRSSSSPTPRSATVRQHGPFTDHGRQPPGAGVDDARRGSRRRGPTLARPTTAAGPAPNLTFDRRWQRFEDGTWQDVGAPADLHAGRRRRGPPAAVPGAGEQRRGHGRGLLGADRSPARGGRAHPGTDRHADADAVRRSWSPRQPAPGAPAVAPAGRARLSVAFAATGRPTVTVRWGERRKVTGVLVGADGRAAGRRARRDRRHALGERSDGAPARPRDHGRRGSVRLSPARGPVADAHVHER